MTSVAMQDHATEESDRALCDALVSAVKQYSARTEQSPAPAIDKHALTATEAVTAICELMRVADLNPFDVAMWYRRPLPEFGAERG